MYRRNLAGALDRHVFGDLVDIVEQNHADVALLEVEGHAFDAVFELHELVGAHVVQTIYVGHAVAHLKDCACFLKGDL